MSATEDVAVPEPFEAAPGLAGVSVARTDIYNGKVVPFVPFTALAGDLIKGTHNQ